MHPCVGKANYHLEWFDLPLGMWRLLLWFFGLFLGRSALPSAVRIKRRCLVMSKSVAFVPSPLCRDLCRMFSCTIVRRSVSMYQQLQYLRQSRCDTGSHCQGPSHLERPQCSFAVFSMESLGLPSYREHPDGQFGELRNYATTGSGCETRNSVGGGTLVPHHGCFDDVPGLFGGGFVRLCSSR